MNLLSREEIVRELKIYRHDHEGVTYGARVPLKTFGEHVGVCRQSLNAFIHGDYGMSEPTRARLSQAIMDIRAGRLRFVRRDRQWQATGPAVESI